MPHSRPPPQAHTPAGDISGSISAQQSINMQKQVSPNQNQLLESAHLIRLGVEMTNERLNFHSPSLCVLNSRDTCPFTPKGCRCSRTKAWQEPCSLHIAFSFVSGNLLCSLQQKVVNTASAFTDFLSQSFSLWTCDRASRRYSVYVQSPFLRHEASGICFKILE